MTKLLLGHVNEKMLKYKLGLQCEAPKLMQAMPNNRTLKNINLIFLLNYLLVLQPTSILNNIKSK